MLPVHAPLFSRAQGIYQKHLAQTREALAEYLDGDADSLAFVLNARSARRTPVHRCLSFVHTHSKSRRTHPPALGQTHPLTNKHKHTTIYTPPLPHTQPHLSSQRPMGSSTDSSI